MRILVLLSIVAVLTGTVLAADRPNILWLTSEDNGPHYGCYGDTYAQTPNIDALAARGTRFKRCWSNAPVCAPARTCLISGRWAPADGAEHMRSMVPLPQGHEMYPQLLRAAGYYCTNNSKEDYNLAKPGAQSATGEGKAKAGGKKKGKAGGPDSVWDDSSGQAHWQNRKEGQPFFAIFNNQITHESQIRRRPHTLIHDPAKAPLPPFHPDTPEVRHDWAQYYDNITLMDTKLGEYLAELEKAGVAEDTIIMHYGDHGPGMPRFKRWPYNSGLHVGLVMYFPEKWKHLAPKGYAPGGVNDELVSFIDLPATLLSIAGVRPPEYFQGRAVCGAFAGPAREYIHGFRGRMDERYDLVRSTTDGRYVYIHNYMPHLPYGQFLNYMFQQATTRVWRAQFDAGTLTELQARFWKSKPTEELYDLQEDRWETKNLADSAEHQEIKARLKSAQREWLVKTRDLGFIPEAERLATAAGRAPADVYVSEEAYPVEKVHAAAELATSRKAGADELAALLKDPHPVIRYWGAMGHVMGNDTLGQTNKQALEALLEDPSASVRIAAAEALLWVAHLETKVDRPVLALLKSAYVDKSPYMEALEALNVLDRWAVKVTAWAADIKALPGKAPASVDARLKEYVSRLNEHLAPQMK